MKRKAVLNAIVLALILALVASMGIVAAQDKELNIERVFTFDSIADVDAFQKLMLNTTSNTIEAGSATYVSYTVEDGRLKIEDLGTDNILPVLGLPRSDKVYIIKYAEGDFYVLILNWNSTDGTFTELLSVHISPAAPEIAIYPLAHKGVTIIYYAGLKWEVNATGNLIAIKPATEGSTVYADEVVECTVPAEEMSAPFTGTTISGSDERTVEVEVNGRLRVWFYDAHSGGDADLFIFKDSNSYYSQASHTQSWYWLSGYCDTLILADSTAGELTLEHYGKVKLIVKFYSGSTSWEIVYTQEEISQPPTATPEPGTPSAPISFSGNRMYWIAIGIGVFLLIVIVLVLGTGKRGIAPVAAGALILLICLAIAVAVIAFLRPELATTLLLGLGAFAVIVLVIVGPQLFKVVQK